MRILFAGTPDFAAAHLTALIDDGEHDIAAHTEILGDVQAGWKGGDVIVDGVLAPHIHREALLGQTAGKQKLGVELARPGFAWQNNWRLCLDTHPTPQLL